MADAHEECFRQHEEMLQGDAADETGLPLATFLEVCPWTPAPVLDTAFWPEGEPTP